MSETFSIIALSLSEIVGDFGFKKYANSGSLSSFSQGMIGYIGIIYFLIKSLRNNKIIRINALWDSVSALLESLAAYYFLGERLESYEQYIGLGLIISGIFLLKMKK